MKLIRKQIDKNRAGHVTLQAENDEDMWHAYNLISVVSLGSTLSSSFNSGTDHAVSHHELAYVSL